MVAEGRGKKEGKVIRGKKGKVKTGRLEFNSFS